MVLKAEVFFLLEIEELFDCWSLDGCTLCESQILTVWGRCIIAYLFQNCAEVWYNN
jgi:hypothetical protein